MRTSWLVAVAIAAGSTACADAPIESGAEARADGVPGAIPGLLALVPDVPGALAIVTATDYRRAREVVSAGAPPDDPAALAEWYRTNERAARWWPVAFGGGHADVEAWRRDLGFSIADVDAAIEVGRAPDEVRAYLGVDAGTVDAAISSDPVWSGRLVRTERPAGTLHDWGDDARPDATSPARLAGEGGQLLVDGEVAVRTSRRALLDTVLDTVTDTPLTDPTAPRSLGDRDDVRSVVAALEDREVYSLLLSDELVSGEEEFYWSERATDGSRRRWVGFRGSAALLEPYSLIGVGLARGGSGDFVGVIVIAHDDATTATENADRLRRNLESGSSFRTGQRWADVMALREITVEGALTIAVVEPATADGPAQAWLRRDSLFWVPYTL